MSNNDGIVFDYIFFMIFYLTKTKNAKHWNIQRTERNQEATKDNTKKRKDDVRQQEEKAVVIVSRNA